VPSRVRIGLRVAGLILLFLVCVVPHFMSKWALRRSSWPRWFLGASGWICGARARVVGEPIRPHSLLVSNHVSWLDILVLAGATGCRFVSKAELQDHWLLSWLADQNATLYVRRDARGAAGEQARELREALIGPQPVALFPEGTTGPGDRLLPFRSTLLSAVAPAPEAVEVRAAAIDYGTAASEIGWHGETGVENVLRLLGRKGTLPVTVHLLPSLPVSDDRKRIAAEAQRVIGHALGLQVATELSYRAGE
jgi:1-acyl-sn-glycerol-3-phosphate acyltransferase